MIWQPGMTLEYVEKISILAAIKFYQGNKTQTALSLGISVRSLHDKLEKYDAERRAEEERRNKTRTENEAYLQRARGLHRTASGVLLESSTPARAEHTLPVPERKEVQEMLQKPVRSGRSRSTSQRA